MARNGLVGSRKPYRRQSTEAIRKSADRLEAAIPPRPIIAWRDQQHQGVIRFGTGLCVRCFGFPDDPRHNGRELAVTVFRFDLLTSVFAVNRRSTSA